MDEFKTYLCTNLNTYNNTFCETHKNNYVNKD